MKSQRGFTPIILILGILLLATGIAIGGLYYFRNNLSVMPKLNLNISTRTPQPTNQPSLIPATSSSPISASSMPPIVQINGSSMMPIYVNGQFWKYELYQNSKPNRGDVVAFKNPLHTSQLLVKRVIGLPGEEIKIEGGSIYINGQLLNESYLSADVKTDSGTFIKEGSILKIEADQYALLGDNRNHSSDSRHTGWISNNFIIGKLVIQEQPVDLPQDKCLCWISTANTCLSQTACK